MIAHLVNCRVCNKQFEPPHFNSKCCSNECRELAIKTSKKKYKKSENGKESQKRYISGNSYKEKEKRYRGSKKAKSLAVKRSKRCLENNAHLQEAKKERDRLYGRSETGREINKISSAKYRKTEKGKQVAKNSKSRRRQAERAGNITLSQWSGVLERYRNKCANCGCSGKLELDHIYPLSKGGAHCVSNIQPLCRSCNASKGAKIYGW